MSDIIHYLYVKQHNQTGLKYFGYTSFHKDPYRYKGSGTYWRRHLQKHGFDVSTTHLWEFTDHSKCIQFAQQFSVENNIVESSEWANLKIEEGQNGGGCSDKHRNAMKTNNPMWKIDKSTYKGGFKPGHKPHVYSDTDQKKSIAKRGRLNPNYQKTGNAARLNIKHRCSKCGILTNLGNLKRWHNDKCRL